MAVSPTDKPANPGSAPSARGAGRPTPTAVAVAVAPLTAAERAELETLRRQVVELQRISSLGVLAGSIVHELNNALTPILNYAKLGLRNPDPEFRRRAFEKILEGSQRAGAIANGVLGLARPRADRRDPTDLNRLVEEVLFLTAKDLQKHRISVEVKAEGRPHARVNPAQVQQVLLNLVINARQAMAEGGQLTVTVGLDTTGRWAEVRVSDTGSGIPPEALPHIFEPFFTTKTGPDATGMGGTGLGLPVCRDIVESHRGRLRVESRPGQGASFTLRLPACPAAAAESGRQGAA